MDENSQLRRRRYGFPKRWLLVGVVLPAVAAAIASAAAVRYSHRSDSLQLVANLRSAQSDLEVLQDADRKAPGCISRSEMRRAELARDAAQLNVQRAQAVPVWQRDEIRDLDRRLAALQIEMLEVELEQAKITSARDHEHFLELMRRIPELEREIAEAQRRAAAAGK
jgi:hypothetical protein